MKTQAGKQIVFSSSDHYDDPFDTYFYIDVDQMVPVYEEMKRDLLEGNKELAEKLQQIAILAGQRPDAFVSMDRWREYLGHTVNFKTQKKSYKSKKTILNPESE